MKNINNNIKIYKALPLSLIDIKKIFDDAKIYNNGEDFVLSLFVKKERAEQYGIKVSENEELYELDDCQAEAILSDYFDIDVKYLQPYAEENAYVMFLENSSDNEELKSAESSSDINERTDEEWLEIELRDNKDGEILENVENYLNSLVNKDYISEKNKSNHLDQLRKWLDTAQYGDCFYCGNKTFVLQEPSDHDIKSYQIDKIKEKLEEYLEGLEYSDYITYDDVCDYLDDYDRWSATANYGDEYIAQDQVFVLEKPNM